MDKKYETVTPTAKSHHSRNYYKKVEVVLPIHYYPTMSSHTGRNNWGTREHENHFVFDLWYNNTSLIQPTVLTGDMHSINKANFAIFH